MVESVDQAKRQILKNCIGHFETILHASNYSLVLSGHFIMTSPTIDHDGIEPVISTPTKMNSLDVDAISDIEWKEFANNMQISDSIRMRSLAKFCNPKLLRKFFSSDMAARNLHQAAHLGKIDVIKVLLSLGGIDVNKIHNGVTALHYAAREGHLDIVSILLEEENINANLTDEKGNTALHIAALNGHELVFDRLVKAQKVDVNSTNDFGQTAFILAVERGYEKTVDTLLKMPNGMVALKDPTNNPLHAAAANGHVVIVKMMMAKMDVNSTNDERMRSPLHIATHYGHENVVDLLLQAPTVKPSLKDCDGETPLHIAARKGRREILEKLLQMNEVDVNDSNNEGETTLHLAATKKDANIVTKLLEVPNVDPCPKTKDNLTPLHMAAKFGRANVVQVLLATGKMDVNITDSKKRTTLHCAIEGGHFNVVEVLLRVPNVIPCLGDEEENTPLHYATKLGHQGITERLLAIPDLDVNKVNKKKKTPLFFAARYGFVNVVDLLLENPKVDFSICDEHGDSPFHVAVKGGHTNIAEKLITPPRVVPVHSNKENLTGLHLCIRGGHENLVDILLKQPSMDANAKDACGNFPIHYAAQNGNTCILQKILNAHGVDVNSINDHLETALHVAVMAGHIDVIDLLLQVPTLNVSMQDWHGNSALHKAANYGEEGIIEKLLKANGVDVNAKSQSSFTALCYSARGGHVRIVDKLLEVQEVLNNEGVVSVDKRQGEPYENDSRVLSLLLATYNGHDTIIKSLLAHGVDVNGTHESFPGTAIFEAIQYGDPKVVEVLLGAPNIDPNRRDRFGNHPLFLAARHGQKEIVEMLMATGQIGVNVLSNGETTLQGAAGKGREQVVKILLNTPSIDVRVKTKNGETALFYAARADNKKILKDIYNASKITVGRNKRLVQKKLNINDVNNKGKSIIHLAARENLLNVIDFLLEVFYDDARSVDVNLKTSPPKGKEDGFIPQSALQIAINAHHYSIIEKLTKFQSISFIQEEEDGKTVLQHIFDKKQWETFNIIMRRPEVTNYIDALYKDRQASVDAANAILVGAALIASVTFASWLQPPLGYATYYHEQFSDSLPAPPVAYPEYAAFDHHPSLQAFWVFNSLSFFSAIATVISGARSVLPAEKLFIKQEVENLRWNLLRTSILLGFSMFFVLLAFATAGVVVLPPVMKFRANIFSTIGIGGSVCFMFLFSFGKIIYKLRSDIQSSQASKRGFFELWGFKPWYMANPFNRSQVSKDQAST